MYCCAGLAHQHPSSYHDRAAMAFFVTILFWMLSIGRTIAVIIFHQNPPSASLILIIIACYYYAYVYLAKPEIAEGMIADLSIKRHGKETFDRWLGLVIFLLSVASLPLVVSIFKLN